MSIASIETFYHKAVKYLSAIVSMTKFSTIVLLIRQSIYKCWLATAVR